MRMGPVFFSAILVVTPSLCAQEVSLGLGTGLARFSGGSSFSVFTASPSVQHFSPYSYIGIGGAVSLLEAGEWAGQARGDLWAALMRRERGLRPAVSTALSATQRSDGDAAASGSFLLEGFWTGGHERGDGGAALGIGAVSGVIERTTGVTALRLRGRGWWHATGSPEQLSLTVEANRFVGAWYTDVVGGLSFDRNRVVASVWASGRLSATYGSSAAVSAALLYYFTPTLAFEASGGNYLADPYQGLPRAGFVTGGIRLFTSRRVLKSVTPTPGPPVLHPLIAQRRGDTLVVRFRMPAARTVAIAGNWNTWTPAPLRNVGDDIWEATLHLEPGVYYFNLVVDGNEWVVPGGVATLSDGMGGLMAVLNVL